MCTYSSPLNIHDFIRSFMTVSSEGGITKDIKYRRKLFDSIEHLGKKENLKYNLHVDLELAKVHDW